LIFALGFINQDADAQAYTSIYNGVNYSSSRPYNLNVVYFVPNDIPLDPTYKTRLSTLMLWGQNFYKQNMINNGYGAKTFGLFTETGNAQNIKIILISGTRPHTDYTYSDRSRMDAEINAYFASNPAQKTSDHTLILTAVTNPTTANVPYYGTGRTCYALDYPQMDIQYMGRTDSLGQLFTGWYGGMLHELGHGLNLPHSHQTNSEYNNPNKGTNLMYYHGTLGTAPTFMNRAGCAILNNCQVFADAPGITYYNGNTSSLTSLHAVYDNGDLVVSGTFQSNRLVKDVNIYQDPYATPSAGYYAVVWSVSPLGNSFSVRMPVSDLEFTNQAYNLWIELVLQNGERTFNYYQYSYNNGIPNINIDFGTVSTCVGGSLQLATNITGTSYQWQYQYGGNWYNYPEGNNGYATFSGTHSATMTVSGISAGYITNPNTARAAITLANGSVTYSTPQVWKADGIITQPPSLTTACVGGTLQIAAQASGTGYQWQYQNANGSWSDYPEGAVSGYATFSGTKTATLTVSNISSAYINNPNQARLVVYGGNGCYTVSNTVTWKAEGIATQPTSQTACVNGTLTLSTQALGASYQWQYLSGNNWYNYPEGYNGYATFTGSKTATMTVSTISNHYVTNPNQARLLVTGTNGCTATSNTVTWKATTCGTMSAKVKMNNEQAVYPNPVSHELTIDLGAEDDNYKVEIMNSVGQMIYSTNTVERTLKVPFTEKASGIYIIKITGKQSGASNSYRVVKP
jgi:hypothetical protein